MGVVLYEMTQFDTDEQDEDSSVRLFWLNDTQAVFVETYEGSACHHVVHLGDDGVPHCVCLDRVDEVDNAHSVEFASRDIHVTMESDRNVVWYHASDDTDYLGTVDDLIADSRVDDNVCLRRALMLYSIRN
jgi:hypothetical protein